MISPPFSALVPCKDSFPPSLYNCVDRTNITSLLDVVLIAINVIKILLSVAGVIAVIMVVVAAIQYIMSQGSPAEVARAKSSLANVVIGLVLIVGAYAIINFIAGIF